jgi:hypothetical protein
MKIYVFSRYYGLEVKLASDGSGAYVPVVVLDSDSSITIGAVAQDGTWVVTANGGANLNTSALALETGNIATLASTVSNGKIKVDPSGVAIPVQQVTPVAATSSTITTGGTAVIIVTGPCNGGYVTNPVNAAAQGLSVTENAYLDFVNTPGSTDSAANGTTILIEPGQNFTLPPLAPGSNLKANAASNGHKLTVVVW